MLLFKSKKLLSEYFDFYPNTVSHPLRLLSNKINRSIIDTAIDDIDNLINILLTYFPILVNTH